MGKNKSSNNLVNRMVKQQKEIAKQQKIQAKLRAQSEATCCHFGPDKKGRLATFLGHEREENGIKVATCELCKKTVIVDDSLLNSTAELEEAKRLIESKIAITVYAATIDKRYKMDEAGMEKLIKFRGTLISVIGDFTGQIEDYLNRDDDDDYSSKKKKNKGKGKKKAKKKLF